MALITHRWQLDRARSIAGVWLRTNLVLLIILSVALGLRLWGIAFGLPHTYHLDEGALVMPALDILHTGDFNPHRFDYGSVHIYLLAIIYAAYFLAGARAGIFNSIQDIPVIQDYHSIANYPYPTVFLVGRIASVLLGVVAVYCVYRIGTRTWDRRAGWVAASLYAIVPGAVGQSHYIVSDTSMIVLMLIALEVLIVAYEQDRIRLFAVAGLFVGLAASSKQTAIQLAITVVIAAILSSRLSRRRSAAIMAGIGGVIVGFLIGTPFALFDLPTFLNWQAYDLRLYARPGAVLVEGPSWAWHLRFLFTSENAILIAVSLVGIVVLLRRHPRLGWLLVSFPVLHWVSMGMQATRHPRTWLPTAPFVCLFAAVAIIAVAGYLSEHHLRLPQLSRLIVIAVLVAIAFPLIARSVVTDIYLNEPDVRTRALDWIEANLPPGSHLAVELVAPPLPPEQWPITRTVSLPQHDFDWYRAQGVGYLVASEDLMTSPNRTVEDEAWYQRLREACQPLAAIAGQVYGQPDRHIYIYELKACKM